MTRRRIFAVLGATVVLVAALNAFMYNLYRVGERAFSRALADRLDALGHTTARWLAAASASRDGPDPDALLRELVAENRLEDAYLVDAELHVLHGARTPAGAALNLLRVDSARFRQALAATGSVAPGYSLADVAIDTGYFHVDVPGGAVLVLEAGADLRAPITRLRATWWISVGITIVLAGLFLAGVLLGLRALERARLAHGRAERLAAVGQMAAMVAHEVRNPLGILRMQLELLRERLAESAGPRDRERFGEMLAEIERLNRLTTEFMALARDVPVEPVRCDVGALVSETVASLNGRAEEGRVVAEVPAGGAEIVTRADPLKLRQAILNLVQNALQVGGEDVHVKISTARAGDDIRIVVADDGPGVPEALRATLFEPFVSARPGGSGLGLAVARRIAERHGGRLDLEPSAPGARGATFVLAIPAEPGRRA